MTFTTIPVGPLLQEDSTKPNMAAGGEGGPKQLQLDLYYKKHITKPNMAAGGEGRPKKFQLDLYYKKTPQNQTWQQEGKEDLNRKT